MQTLVNLDVAISSHDRIRDSRVSAVPVGAAPWASSLSKRLVETVIVAVALPLVVLGILILGAISACAFRANPFFMQTRRGLDDVEIRVIKLRSLPKTFASATGKHEIAAGQICGYSSLLRRTHLDELPQLLHVLTGKMALVGPRPMIDGVLDLLDERSLQIRSMVRPGLTGSWQISTMGAHSLHECTELDTAYVFHASWRADAWIIFRTVVSSLGMSSVEPERAIARLSG